MKSMPKPTTVGNPLKVASALAEQGLVSIMVKACLLQEHTTLPLYNKFQSIQEEVQVLERTGSKIEDVVAISNFCKLPDENMSIDWLSARSDLLVEDIQQMALVNPDYIAQLMEAEHQLKPSLKVTDRLKIYDVTKNFMTECADKHGNFLKTFKRQGGFDPLTGTLDWTHGVYTVTWKDGFADTITWRGQESVNVFSEKISAEFDLVRNFSDMRCAFHKAGRKDQELHQFFAQGTNGPHGHDYLKMPSSKCKAFQDLEAKAYNSWIVAKKAAEQATQISPQAKKAAAAVKEVRSKERAEIMGKAREAAKHKLEERTRMATVVSKRQKGASGKGKGKDGKDEEA